MSFSRKASWDTTTRRNAQRKSTRAGKEWYGKCKVFLQYSIYATLLGT